MCYISVIIALQALTGVPAAQQRLQFAGRLLQDDAQGLAAAGLRDDSLLQLTLPLRGGAPVKVGSKHFRCYGYQLQCMSRVSNTLSARPKVAVARQRCLHRPFWETTVPVICCHHISCCSAAGAAAAAGPTVRQRGHAEPVCCQQAWCAPAGLSTL
jgi:hypothetical protein